MKLRPVSEADLPALVALQHSLTPPRRKTTEAVMRDSLFEKSHEFGKNACAVESEGRLMGVAGWVRGNCGEFFGAPVLAANEGAAVLLLDHLLAQASGCRWMRVSCFPEDKVKRAELDRRGFALEFEFVEFEIRPAQPLAPALPVGLKECSLTKADPALLMELSNLSFTGVDNTLPMDEADAREIIESEMRDSRLSLLWKDGAGKYLAFAITNTDGYLDSIGVHPEAQKLGYGSMLYRRVLAFAAERKMPRIYTTVSSRNVGSLRLHHKLGIPEVERRQVMQKNLK